MENKNNESSELIVIGNVGNGERLIIFRKEKEGYVAINSPDIKFPVSRIKSSLNEHDLHSNTYPYLVVRIISGCYRILSLPKDLTEEELLAITIEHGKASNLRISLVMSAFRALYVELDGSVNISTSIPSGGTVLY